MAALEAFPDTQYIINQLVAEGDIVAVRVTRTGTHKAEYHGIPPTGKRIILVLAFFYRLSGGNIVEALPYSDLLVLYQQLGVIFPGQ